MLKQFLLVAFLCCGFNSFAGCFDSLDPNNTLRSSNVITLDDAKRSCNYILENVRFDSKSDDDDCIKSDDRKCLSIACNIVTNYFKEHYENYKSKFLFSNEDIHFLFFVNTFLENTNLTPTPENYQSFLNYMLGLFDASNTEQQLKDKEFVANRSGLQLARIKQWKAAGKLDSIANDGYKYSLRINTSNLNLSDYLDSVICTYNAGAPLILDIQIDDKEFKTITEELRLKLVKCHAYCFFCERNGIKNKDVTRAKKLLEKWKKIHTDRFGEILLKGDKKYYISDYLVKYSLTKCGNEMVFNDYYNMFEEILIDNKSDKTFKTYLNMYKERTLYDYLRNIYLRNITMGGGK